MRALLSLILVAAVSGSVAANEAKLELALHDLAAVARKAGMQKLVVVARLEATSAQATDADLNTIEQMALEALQKEQGVACSSNEKARDAARVGRAKRPLTVEEGRLLKNAAGTDGVVTLDYREAKERSTVRLALSDGNKIQFAESVALQQKVGGLGELAGKKPAANNAGAQGGQPNGGPKAGPIGGNGEQFVPSAPPGASGYAIATNGGNPNYVRKPSSASTDAGGEAGAKAGAGGKGEGGAKAGGGASSTGGGQKASTSGTKAGGGATAGGGAGGGAVAGGSATPAQPGAAATEIGQRILQFGTSHLGQQVGNGECWTLAADAMKAAGAQPPDGYTFGDEIPLRSIRPGDILQFTTARFDEPGYYAVMGAPNHTAIVYSAAGDRVFMLHQNFNGKRTVSTFDFNLASLSSGRIQAYRPRPR